MHVLLPAPENELGGHASQAALETAPSTVDICPGWHAVHSPLPAAGLNVPATVIKSVRAVSPRPDIGSGHLLRSLGRGHRWDLSYRCYRCSPQPKHWMTEKRSQRGSQCTCSQMSPPLPPSKFRPHSRHMPCHPALLYRFQLHTECKDLRQALMHRCYRYKKILMRSRAQRWSWPDKPHTLCQP